MNFLRTWFDRFIPNISNAKFTEKGSSKEERAIDTPHRHPYY